VLTAAAFHTYPRATRQQISSFSAFARFPKGMELMLALASDHGGYTLKEHLKSYLTAKGIACRDFGTDSLQSCDYPTYVLPAAQAVADGSCERGIVLCSTGIGASIAANKVPGIRCALCGEPFSAEMTRRHNDANVLALGAFLVGPGLAERIVDTFLATEFEGGRHSRRIGLIADFETQIHPNTGKNDT